MKVRSSVQPEPIQILGNSVLVATNITPYEETIDDRTVTGYEYECQEYSKDEYLLQQAQSIQSLSEQLTAAKILLGVD